MGEMIGSPSGSTRSSARTPLEAQVRELRLIAAHKPRYNRRSKFPERSVWLTLTDEAFPRLSIVREPDRPRPAELLPRARSRRAGRPRPCATRSTTRCRCASAPIGCRCAEPCGPPACSPASAAARRPCESADVARRLHAPGRARAVELDRATSTRSSTRCAGAWPTCRRPQRFEQAAAVRDRMTTLVRACARMQRISALTDDRRTRRRPARRRRRLGARGRPARAAGGAPASPRAASRRCRSSRRCWPAPRSSRRGPGPLPAALAEETEVILRWLEEPGTRLVVASQPWLQPGPRRGPVQRPARHRDARRSASIRSPTGGGCRCRPARAR